MKASPNKATPNKKAMKATPKAAPMAMKATKKAIPKAAPKAMKVKAMKKATPTKRHGGDRKAGTPSSYMVVSSNLKLSSRWRRKAEEEKEKVEEQLKKERKEKKKLENELEGKKVELEKVELAAKNELKKLAENLEDDGCLEGGVYSRAGGEGGVESRAGAREM